MPSGSHDIQIVEQDGATIRITGSGPHGIIEVICDMEWDGQTLVLRSLHADGSGPRSLGISAIREFAREFARQQHARAIKIHGGMRTSGAKPGKIPRPIKIQIPEIP
jgi:hypothetical protein